MVDRLVLAGLLSLALLPHGAAAGELVDPTRPPSFVAVPGATVEAPTGLSFILISGDRRAAIIDGARVELGGMHGDARLIEVNEGHVILKKGKALQRLTLFPEVSMTQSSKMPEKHPENSAQPGTQAKPVAHKEEK